MITIPDPAGTPTAFAVAEDSVMGPELQAAHPDIRTYSGADRDGSSIRLDVTPFGFHALVRRPDGVSWYVDPATDAVGESRVLSYAGAAMGAAPEPFVEQRGGARRAGCRQGRRPRVHARRAGHPAHLPAGLPHRPHYAAYFAPGVTDHRRPTRWSWPPRPR